jgi:putative transposase
MDCGPHRKRLRLPHHDYGTPGAYFVTVCTHERASLFGGVADGTVQLNHAGRMVGDAWAGIPARHSAVALDTFVVLPDHLHGIIVLQEPAASGADLPELMRRFKSFTTARWRGATGAMRLWQRGYHDRVVRGDGELDRIRRYIEENPQRWAQRRDEPPGQDSAESP